MPGAPVTRHLTNSSPEYGPVANVPPAPPCPRERDRRSAMRLDLRPATQAVELEGHDDDNHNR